MCLAGLVFFKVGKKRINQQKIQNKLEDEKAINNILLATTKMDKL
jgi:hypothetical protein